ncbi:class I SAM-dependent methyltransferase [Xanthobacter sp. TB0139]|uniref:class I SAM-dependent methyltransferase n=1 Tax=Xanthobacter sp. TB0139 TaxID=3459178 RepID=UPI00403A7841
MRLRHFEELKPICPACRLSGREMPLVLGPGAQEGKGGIESGFLCCPSPDCGQAYPIIDGAPILVPDVQAWLAANGHLLLQRQSLADEVENVVGRAMGADAAFNVVRQQESSYAFDHYGDLDPTPRPGAAPGAVRRCLAAAQSALPPVTGAALDIGCAVGRTSFDLAEEGQGLVLGIDLNWPLLRIARGVLEDEVASYPLRMLGLNFERQRHAARFAGAEQVDFWVADALCLPFSANIFGQIMALNVMDCVSDPARLVAEMLRVGGVQAGLAMATPFDWAGHATPLSHWLEGPAALEAMLQHVSSLSQAAGQGRFVACGPAWDMTWQVRLHERSTMQYQAHFCAGVVE